MLKYVDIYLYTGDDESPVLKNTLLVILIYKIIAHINHYYVRVLFLNFQFLECKTP